MTVNADDWAVIALESGSLAAEPKFRIRVGKTKDRVYAAEEFRPVLVLGPQRSYKTSGFAVPAILEWGGPALVTSVRQDILDDSFKWRSSLGKVSIFDPSGLLLDTQYEPYRRSWNPLNHCDSWDDCVKTGRALTEAGKTLGLQEANFWNSLASQFVAPLLLAARWGGLTFKDVVRWIKDPEESQWNEVMPLLEDFGNVNALGSYRTSYVMEARARSGVLATLWSAFRIFDYDQVLQDTAEELNISEFLSSRADTLYICAPPDEQEEYRAQFTAVVRTVLRDTYKKNQAYDPSGGKGDAREFGEANCPLLVLLDEAGNIAALENLGTLATTAAGTSIQLVCIFHDLSQMERVYGSFEARSIINNHSAFVVLPGCRDTATLMQLEALLRGERVANASESQWNSPRQIRSMRRGSALLIYENLRPIVLSLRSKFTDQGIAHRVNGAE
jgi:type IV secretion system protein VirD4